MKSRVKGLLGVALVGCVVASSAQTVFPLRLDMDVSTKRHRKNIGAGSSGEAKVEQVQVRVKIRKSGGQPYSDTLTAELYVIGRQIHTGYYGIVDVVKNDFTFSRDNDNTFEFKSRMYALGRTSGNINVGGKYETFLLVVVDKDGKIIDTRSGRVIREKGIDTIREWTRGTLFDRDGNVVGFIDENGKNRAFKLAVPAAVSGNDW
ncbi:MAG: hypothetical protein KAU94_08760 [Verrucomicrobia bacterium]|nr:hypothetical protein [Verrucomicrobiota bacterium]